MQAYKISIAEPCHESWEGMTTAQQGRFCAACAKTVVDFTSMTDTQVLNYFLQKKTEQTCGRFFDEQLDVPLHPYQPRPVKKKRYIAYLAGLMMLFVKPVKAQQKYTMGFFGTRLQPTYAAPLKLKADTAPNKLFALQEKKSNKIVPVAAPARENEIMAPVCTKQNTIRRAKTVAATGEETRIRMGGAFMVDAKQQALYVVDGRIEPKADYINPDDVTDVTVLQGPAAAAIYGAQGMYGAIVITTKKAKQKSAIPVRKQTVAKAEEHPAQKLSIFPNPVQHGSSFSFELPAGKNDLYTLIISDLNGNIVLNKKIEGLAGKKILASTTGWISGLYSLKLIDGNATVLYSGSIVVL